MEKLFERIWDLVRQVPFGKVTTYGRLALLAGNPRLAYPLSPAPDRAAFFAAYALEPFDQVRREFCRLPPLPVRAAGRLLSPEVKAAIRKKLK